MLLTLINPVLGPSKPLVKPLPAVVAKSGPFPSVKPVHLSHLPFQPSPSNLYFLPSLYPSLSYVAEVFLSMGGEGGGLRGGAMAGLGWCSVVCTRRNTSPELAPRIPCARPILSVWQRVVRGPGNPWLPSEPGLHLHLNDRHPQHGGALHRQAVRPAGQQQEVGPHPCTSL